MAVEAKLNYKNNNILVYMYIYAILFFLIGVIVIHIHWNHRTIIKCLFRKKKILPVFVVPLPTHNVKTAEKPVVVKINCII